MTPGDLAIAPVSAPAVLGSAVRRARRAHQWTQAALARRAGCGVRMVNELECNRRPHISLSVALTIAHAVGLEIAVRNHGKTG